MLISTHREQFLSLIMALTQVERRCWLDLCGWKGDSSSKKGPCIFVRKRKPMQGGEGSGKGCWHSLTLAQEEVKA